MTSQGLDPSLEDLLFAGLAERPIWSKFLRRLTIDMAADRAFLIVEGHQPLASAMAIVSPDPAALADIAQRVSFDQLKALPMAQPQRIDTDAGVSHIVRCAISQGRSIWLSVAAVRQDPKVCDDLLARLVPLLCRVLPLYELLADTVREYRVAEYVIEASGTGTMLVDADGQLVSANAIARQVMAQDGALTVCNGALFAHSPDATRQLREAIAEMSQRQSPEIDPHCYLPVALPDPNRLHPLTLIVRPGPPYGPVSAPLKRTAILIVRDPARPALLAVADIERLFALSPAEARLATRLVDGEALDEAAIGLGVSRNTARSQLQSIYTKTGVNRQGDLVRLLLSSAASQVGDLSSSPSS